MERSRLAVTVVCAALFAAALGCNTATNTNGNGNGNASATPNANANAGANANAANANANAGGGTGNLNANISREDFDRTRERFEREAREAGRKVGSGANDLWLWTKTRAALAAADDLRDSTVSVDVENDVVTLTGTVGSDAQKSRAEAVAKGVEGVKSVRNQLTVSAGGGNANGNGNANTKS